MFGTGMQFSTNRRRSLYGWVAYLKDQRTITSQTIKAYVKGLKSYHFDIGYPQSELEIFSHSTVKRIIDGIKGKQCGAVAIVRLPITKTVLLQQLPGQGRSTDNEREEWEIEKIIDRRRTGSGYEYIVRWTDTWLPESELGNAQELVRVFEAQGHVQPGRKRGRSARSVAALFAEKVIRSLISSKASVSRVLVCHYKSYILPSSSRPTFGSSASSDQSQLLQLPH